MLFQRQQANLDIDNMAPFSKKTRNNVVYNIVTVSLSENRKTRPLNHTLTTSMNLYFKQLQCVLETLEALSVRFP